jgi:dihydrofolate synthase/folylpolyglutamate synthase
MQRHKDAPALLHSLLRPGDEVRVVTLPEEHQSWNAAELEQATGVPMDTASGALCEELAWLVDSAALPVACGSLYLVAELLPLLQTTD